MSSSNTAQCFPAYVNDRLQHVTASAMKRGGVWTGQRTWRRGNRLNGLVARHRNF